MWWILIGVAIVVAMTGYFVFGRVGGAASADVVGRQACAPHDRQAERPAEPGAEDQAVVGDGVIGPEPRKKL